MLKSRAKEEECEDQQQLLHVSGQGDDRKSDGEEDE